MISEEHALKCANRIANAQRMCGRLVFVATLEAEVEFWKGKEDFKDVAAGALVLVSGHVGDCCVRIRLIGDPDFAALVDPVMLSDWREVLP